jgi:UTP:GlnB (protein PII) uridylyltransferase
MVNPEKSKKKGGIQVCALFPPDVYQDIEFIMKTDKRWFKETDFIREAVSEKIERWKKEHPTAVSLEK